MEGLHLIFIKSKTYLSINFPIQLECRFIRPTIFRDFQRSFCLQPGTHSKSPRKILIIELLNPSNYKRLRQKYNKWYTALFG